MSTYFYSTHQSQIPKDDEGYVKSFSLDQPEQYLQFFHQYGVVVIHNIVSDDECDRTAEEVWTLLSKDGIKKDDSTTWENWPWGAHLGILGNDFIMSKQACENRQHPNVHQLFTKLFDTEKLIVSLDRVGMMRPTVDHPEWKSITGWLHWDANPWTGRTSLYGWGGNFPFSPHHPSNPSEQVENNCHKQLKVQGILALYDCSEREGGLHGVPGFHHDMEKWAQDHLDLKHDSCYPNVFDETTVQVPDNDPLRQFITPLPIRKGSLLVWDSRIPHGTHPNNSDKFRLIQYIKMAPTTDLSIVPAMKMKGIFPKEWLNMPHDFELTDVGAKLYGVQPW